MMVVANDFLLKSTPYKTLNKWLTRAQYTREQSLTVETISTTDVSVLYRRTAKLLNKVNFYREFNNWHEKIINLMEKEEN